MRPNGREGTCRVEGRKRAIVNAGHVARTPAYSAELLDSWTQQLSPERIFSTYDPAQWPDPTTVAAVKVRVRNRTDQPIVFRHEPGTTHTAITFTSARGYYGANPLRHIPSACAPLLDRTIEPRGQLDGWVIGALQDKGRVDGIDLSRSASDKYQVRIRLNNARPLPEPGRRDSPASRRLAVDRIRRAARRMLGSLSTPGMRFAVQGLAGP